MQYILLFLLFLFPMQVISKKPCSCYPKVEINPRECHKKTYIKGIIIIEAGRDLTYISREQGISVLMSDPKLYCLKRDLSPYLCEEMNQDSVKKIKQSIMDYLQQQEIFAMVITPEQEVTDGVVIFEILESKVGRVTYDGPKWFPTRFIKDAVGIEYGDVIDQNALLNELAWLNRNPFHRTEMILSPSEEKRHTDIDFITQDRFPLRGFIGTDNYGVPVNDKWRLFLGVTWGNALYVDDLLTYQYTASYNFHSLQTHFLSYTSFLPSYHILKVFGSYGEIHPDITGFQSDGKSAQASFRYQIPKPPFYTNFQSYWECGFDFKYINSNLFFTSLQDLPVVTTNVDITQFMGGYYLKDFWGPHQISFKAELFASIWKNWFPNQSNANYRALRPFSHVRYAYGKIRTGYRYEVDNGVSISSLFRAQAASGPLMASEQFSLGGIDTVRGYEQSQFIADNAICLNIELFAPSIPIFRQIKDRLVFSGFADLGWGYNYDATTENFEDQLLAGVGPAVKYEIPTYLEIKASYGVQLNHIPGNSFFGRFYFSFMGSY